MTDAAILEGLARPEPRAKPQPQKLVNTDTSAVPAAAEKSTADQLAEATTIDDTLRILRRTAEPPPPLTFWQRLRGGRKSNSTPTSITPKPAPEPKPALEPAPEPEPKPVRESAIKTRATDGGDVLRPPAEMSSEGVAERLKQGPGPILTEEQKKTARVAQERIAAAIESGSTIGNAGVGALQRDEDPAAAETLAKITIKPAATVDEAIEQLAKTVPEEQKPFTP
ncbi:MAG: hypothetical protein ABSE17_03300 [Candidatus Levyibacteriota bacterium]|jgi:hypothetical protein